jgi:hypothetical protein
MKLFDYLYNNIFITIFNNTNIIKNYHFIFYFGFIICISKYRIFFKKNNCKKENNHINMSKSDSYIIKFKINRPKKSYSDTNIYFIKKNNDLSNIDDDYGQFVYIQ